MQEKLSRFVVQDAAQLKGYIPRWFETCFEGMYHPTPDIAMKLKGIVDRIDINPSNHTFRIIDYKSSRHGTKDLAVEMFRQFILQPFIYLVLVHGQPQTQGLEPDGAALLSISGNYSPQTLSQADFERIKERASSLFVLLNLFITQGTFCMHPGMHCEVCPYQNICRKDVFASLLRARRSKQVKRLEEMQQ